MTGTAVIVPGGYPMRLLRRLAVLVPLLTVSVAGIAVPAAAQTPAPSSYTLHVGIPYVANATAEQQLDLYLPKAAGDLPLIVWVHGGGWWAGDKTSRDVLDVEGLVADGFAIASINYRLAPASIFPAQIQDVNVALSFLWHHAAQYHLDQARFVIGGDSAGGHLANLAGLSENNRPPDFGVDPAVRIAAILDYFGPSELTIAVPERQLDGAEAKLLGGTTKQKPELAREGSPVTWIDPHDPPMLIVHGTADHTVPLAQSQLLMAGLTKAGVPFTYVPVEGAGHGGPAFRTPAIYGKLLAFLHQVLKMG